MRQPAAGLLRDSLSAHGRSDHDVTLAALKPVDGGAEQMLAQPGDSKVSFEDLLLRSQRGDHTDLGIRMCRTQPPNHFDNGCRLLVVASRTGGTAAVATRHVHPANSRLNRSHESRGVS